jgi:hypothetical protein
MRKETLITLTRSQFEAYQARQLAWYDAAHPRGKNTRTSAKSTTPAAKSTPRKNTPRTASAPKVPVATQENITTRMEDLAAKFGLEWDDQDLAVATLEG